MLIACGLYLVFGWFTDALCLCGLWFLDFVISCFDCAVNSVVLHTFALVCLFVMRYIGISVHCLLRFEWLFGVLLVVL